MPIKIVRNEAGNCIEFRGSSNPVYWNSCLSAQINQNDSNTINIVNDVATANSPSTKYEFFQVPFTDFVDAAGLPFGTAQDAVDYINTNGNVIAQPQISYKGTWDADSNTPDLTTGSYLAGDFYFVSVSGSTNLNGITEWGVNDSVIYASGSVWTRVRNTNVPVQEIEASSLGRFDIHVKSDYTGTQRLGTALYPFNTITDAVSAASDGDTILLDGTFTITSSITLDSAKSVKFVGSEGSVVKYASYNSSNGGIFEFSGSNYTKSVKFENLSLQNAGAWAISASKANTVDVDGCTFTNNGWSGNRLDLKEVQTDTWGNGGTLGYDSSQSDLALFYSSECSEGGAVLTKNTVVVEITDCTINHNNKGIEIIDSGFVSTTDGFGFLARNKVYKNVSIGLDLESSTGDATAGSKNFTIYNNAFNYNGDSGAKIEGGIDNTISLCSFKGNWNSGLELSHSSNVKARDLDLDDNNRAGIDAEGDQADGLSSLQIEGGTIRPDATFIAEVFNVQIHNTNAGSNSVKCGLLIKSDVGNINSTAAIIKIDNVGFIEQDYALDVECNLDNLNLIVGDCEFVNSRIKAVRLQGTGNYKELPFSNFTVDIPYVDFTKDNVSKTVSVLDGQNGNVINVYDINALAVVNNGTNFDLILRGSNKVQLTGLSETRTYIGGILQSGTTATVANTLQAFLSETDPSAPEPITTPVVDDTGTNSIISSSSDVVDPVGDDTYASSFSGSSFSESVVFSEQFISNAGEYYTFQINQEGSIAMGFHKSGSTGNYSRSSLTDTSLSPSSFDYGMYYGVLFNDSSDGPHTHHGEQASSATKNSGWYSFSTSNTGLNWLSGSNIKLKAGIDQSGYAYLSYYNPSSSEYVNISRVNNVLTQGEKLHLVIKLGDSNVRVYDVPKIHLLTQNSITGSLSDNTIRMFGDTAGTLASGVTVNTASDNDDGFISEALITGSSQFFEVSLNDIGDQIFGIVKTDEFSTSAVQSFYNSTASASRYSKFFIGGLVDPTSDRITAIGSDTGSVGSNGSSLVGNGNLTGSSTRYYRVGFGNDGVPAVWIKSGSVWYKSLSKSLVAPTGSYAFMWKGEGNGSQALSLSTGVWQAVQTLTYYAIESPDGQWYYPLFQTEAEANYYDEYIASPVGTGSSQAYTFIDDLSGGTWYLPDSGSFAGVSTVPSASVLSGSTWNYIATGVDSNYAPAVFSQTVSINEGASLNLQVHPADASFTTTVSSVPSWMSYSQPNVTGTGPYVSWDNTNYPSESYTATVTRTNAYGSSNGTLTVNVLNTTPSASLPGTIYDGTVISVSDFNSEQGSVTAPNADGIIGVNQSFTYDLPLTLDDGDSYEWYHHNYWILGILSSSVDKTSDLWPSGENAANTSWDLMALSWKNTSNNQHYAGNPNKLSLRYRGWDNNSASLLPSQSLSNQSDVWKLQNNAGRLEISLNGTLFRSSSTLYGTGSNAPTITFAKPDWYGVTTQLPSFTHTANGAPAPSGFTLVTGSMDTSEILNDGGVVSADDFSLLPGQRLIIPTSWVDTNVLPYLHTTGSGHKAFIGVPKVGRDWSSVELGDYEGAHRWEDPNSGNGTKNTLRIDTLGDDHNTVTSTTDAYFSYAIDYSREGNLSVMRQAPTGNSLTTEPVIGGSFTSISTRTAATGSWAGAGYGTGSIPIYIGSDYGARVRLGTSGLSRISSPLAANHFNVTEDTFSLPLFEERGVASLQAASDLTLSAGQTYKFWTMDSSIESTDALYFALASNTGSVYSTGVTTAGTPGSFGSYVEFAVPSDVPPLKIMWTSGGTNYVAGTPSLAGSTYSAGITSASHVSTTTALNGSDLADGSFIELDPEKLDTSKRIVFDGNFIKDAIIPSITAANDKIWVGLPDTTWSNTTKHQQVSYYTGALFEYVSSTQGKVYVWASQGSNVSSTNYTYTISDINTNPSDYGLSFELNNSGINSRVIFKNGSSIHSLTTTAYVDHNSPYKKQNTEAGGTFTAISSSSVYIGTENTTMSDPGQHIADHVTEINIPAIVSVVTDWNKALDFSGGNEHAIQVNPSNVTHPIRMGSLGVTTSSPLTTGYTSNDTNSRPWATAIVFKIDGNSSNQHIWNQGEGAGSTEDNIYLRLDSGRNLYFGWGRSGALNEVKFASSISTSVWYGVYIGHDGTRLSGNNATAANLMDVFDIRMMDSSNSFASIATPSGYVQSNWSSTGGRMDRSVLGSFTIGGRGGNRNFHGKVASTVITTLKRNVLMPTDSEISLMITDPEKWLTDYKVGNTYRQPAFDGNGSTFAMNNQNSANSTQVWLMGDGTNDSYSNMIRNQVLSTDQNNTKLNLNNMQSNDIETVSIPRLTLN